MSGRNPPSYCTLTLIAMQGHQQKGRQNNTSSNNKDKSNTIIETLTAEDHDDENLHNPETVQDAVIQRRKSGRTAWQMIFGYLASRGTGKPPHSTLGHSTTPYKKGVVGLWPRG